MNALYRDSDPQAPLRGSAAEPVEPVFSVRAKR